MRAPKINIANILRATPDKRLYIGAYGFESRSLGWVDLQQEQGNILSKALVINYHDPKGKNKIEELRTALSKIGIFRPSEINYGTFNPYKDDKGRPTDFEQILEDRIKSESQNVDEIILDITALTKFLILLCLSKLQNFKGTLRIIYTEAKNYTPSKSEYEKSKTRIAELAKFPSRGFETILRARCLSSIRMQGQPVTLVAFTSFNEQLVRYMLGSISPHSLVFINCKPPRADFEWREKATMEIHKALINEYYSDNPLNEKGLLVRTCSTLNYSETILELDKIYEQIGLTEKIIIAATGSKMQTVGLLFSKVKHPDVHIEYPTPDSYYFKNYSQGVKTVHEIIISNFSLFLSDLYDSSFAFVGQ